LGIEGAFVGFKVLVGMFYSIDKFDERPGAALRDKGFDVIISLNEQDFIDKLPKADVAWIISGSSWVSSSDIKNKFVEAVLAFQQGGSGVCLWADNDPYNVHANAVSEKLFGATVHGCDSCQMELILGDALKSGHFGRHIITTGINKLYEGHTVCYYDKVPEKLNVLATSSYHHAVILYADEHKLAPHEGRVIVDNGFTKLYLSWDSAGTARYVRNLSVWLLGLDHRMKQGMPLKGRLESKQKVTKVIWQYLHGKWLNYDNEASDVVEQVYQEWSKTKTADVRAVKSGTYQYHVDFNQNKQTNIQHPDHTVRDIRRTEIEVEVDI